MSFSKLVLYNLKNHIPKVFYQFKWILALISFIMKLKCFECGFLTLYDTNLEKIISGYLLSVATGPVPSGAGRCRSGLVPVSTEFAKSSQEML